MKAGKLPNDYKALIKDLESQVDFLVGYSHSGEHWKREYHTRQDFIQDILGSELTPPEIVDKVNRIMEKIYELRHGIITNQDYLKAAEELLEQKGIVFYGSAEMMALPKKAPEHPLKIKHLLTGNVETVFI